MSYRTALTGWLTRAALLIVVKNKQPECRGPIVKSALAINADDQISQRLISVASDFFQCLPKRLFQADARLAPRPERWSA
jgi:hypothetical protein